MRNLYDVNAPGFEETEKEISITGVDQADLNIILNEAGPLYTIKGTVWGRTTENVTINVSGTVSAQFQTNSVRNFTLPSLPSGSYIVMPKAAGYRFFPDQRIFTILERTPRRISFFAITKFLFLSRLTRSPKTFNSLFREILLQPTVASKSLHAVSK